MSFLSKLLSRFREPKVTLSVEPSPLPPGLKAAPSLPGGLFAHDFEQIVCDGPNQHFIAHFRRDVKIGDMFDPEALFFYGKPPPLGAPPEQCVCHICGAPWFAGNGHFHFKDGWR